MIDSGYRGRHDSSGDVPISHISRHLAQGSSLPIPDGGPAKIAMLPHRRKAIASGHPMLTLKT